MIEFKKNVKKVLPYDRQQYLDYLFGEGDSSIKWYAVSFQLGREEREISLTEYVKSYENLFKNLILKLDNGSSWIVYHEYSESVWFPNKENNLAPLRNLFKQRNVPNDFKGALICKKEDLIEFYRELISYPCAVFNRKKSLYDNLDISHSELPFILKISGHKCIDFLSTDEERLKIIVNENVSSLYVIKEYTGTSLWT